MNKIETYNSPLIDELFQGITHDELEKVEKRMLLAARIDDAIKAKKWKKKDFAEALGKSNSEISKWLSGTHNFTSDTLFDIERILNLTLIQLEDRSEETITTYVVQVTSNSPQGSLGSWDSIIFNDSHNPTYKRKINAEYRN